MEKMCRGFCWNLIALGISLCRRFRAGGREAGIERIRGQVGPGRVGDGETLFCIGIFQVGWIVGGNSLFLGCLDFVKSREGRHRRFVFSWLCFRGSFRVKQSLVRLAFFLENNARVTALKICKLNCLCFHFQFYQIIKS